MASVRRFRAPEPPGPEDGFRGGYVEVVDGVGRWWVPKRNSRNIFFDLEEIRDGEPWVRCTHGRWKLSDLLVCCEIAPGDWVEVGESTLVVGFLRHLVRELYLENRKLRKELKWTRSRT